MRLLRILLLAAFLLGSTSVEAQTAGAGVTGLTLTGTITPGDCVQWFAVGVLEDAGAGCGGAGGSPGGTTGQIQYNNSGSFGGISTTGTGNVVLATSPTLVTPTLGAASASTITLPESTNKTTGVITDSSGEIALGLNHTSGPIDTLHLYFNATSGVGSVDNFEIDGSALISTTGTIGIGILDGDTNDIDMEITAPEFSGVLFKNGPSGEQGGMGCDPSDGPPYYCSWYTSNGGVGGRPSIWFTDGNQNFVAGGMQGSYSTTATESFTYLPTVPGVPTGTPAKVTGVGYATSAPFQIDTTDNRLYFYNSAWKGIPSYGSTNTFTAANTFSNASFSLTSLGTGTPADALCLTSAGLVILDSANCISSSSRFKTNLQQLKDASPVLKLDIESFQKKPLTIPNRDPNYAHRQVGFIAENVADVLPDCAVYEDDMKTPKSYRPECITAFLVKIAQDHQRVIVRQQFEIYAALLWCLGLTVWLVWRRA